MTDVYYRTGPAAKLLGLSSYELRRLAETELVAAEYTGKQWRFPASEIERLLKDGVPPIPASPNAQADAQPAQRLKAGAGGAGAGLLGPPSERLITATEEVALLENDVRSLGLRQRKEEALDWFRSRERDQAAELADAEAEGRASLAEEQAQRERVEWLRTWEAHALSLIPWGAPPELTLEVQRVVRERLLPLDPIPTGAATQEIVSALAERLLAAWRRTKEIERVIEDAVNRLPSEARSYFKPTAWQIKATQAARQAIRQVDQDASLPEIEAAARQAVEVTAGEFEALQAARADAELREHLVRWVILPAGLPEQDKEMAIQAVRQALAALPLGTPRPGLERAMEEALTPFRLAVAQLQAEARAEQQRNLVRAQAEQRRIQDAANRQSMIATLHRAVPWGTGYVPTPEARAAVAEAIGALPEGASQDELEQARTAALAPILAAHAKRQRKEQAIARALQQVLPRLVELEASGRWDYEGETAWDLARQFTPAIRKQLEVELTGDEPADKVASRIRQLVRKGLETAPAVAQ